MKQMSHFDIPKSFFSFTPRQLEAIETAKKHQFVLYGGSRGPGKSYFLRWYGLHELFSLIDSGISQPVGGLFCESYRMLKDRQISKIAAEFPHQLGDLVDTKERGLGFHLKKKGGGVLVLRNLDDPSKYQSAEFAFILVDELTRNSEEMFHKLRGSLRWPGVPKPRFIAATNPGGPGHLWVRRYWLDRDFPPEMQPLAHEFAFVRALPEDNPYLDQSYWQMLETLPPELARAWRYGDWDVFEGQFFSELRRDVHGFIGSPPPGWTFRAIDYGESAPSAVYWCRVDCSGNVWLYRELYGTGMLYSELARRIVEMSVDELGNPEEIRYTVASPDIFQVSKGTGIVGAEALAVCGVPVIKADPNRIEGWRHMKEWIHSGKLHVSLDACPNWWRTVPAMVYDQQNPEDMDRDAEDHAAEATRYCLMSRPRPLLPQKSPIRLLGRSVRAIRSNALVRRPPDLLWENY